ncbi:hypothetical protein E2C01_070076 [Portunus trituberculatus]|uniref:Uncharacterized protein n=1 Tax=Portunus trituberculatus TaxID=210409 RepID=A0A5B7I0C6_PORTR|nr:hypothetical protein [Portunus trituberculatus]
MVPLYHGGPFSFFS